jgi:hypothetical protein
MTDIIEIREFTEINKYLLKLDPEHSILFFDIDNTLLKLDTDICSDEWVKWQVDLLIKHETHGHHGAKSILHLFDRYCKWMTHTECDVKILEESAPDIINGLLKRGFKIMFVTARNPNISEVTIKQLSKFYDVKKLFNIDVELDNDNFLLKNIANDQPATWRQDGICFLAGQNKGKFIKYIVDKLNFSDYNYLFFDDSIGECKNVRNEFSVDQMIVLHYVYPKKFYSEFDAIDKDMLHHKWMKSIESLNIS